MRPFFLKFCLVSALALSPRLLAAAQEKPLGIQIPGNGSILIIEDCRKIARIDPKVYTGVNNDGVWSSPNGENYFMATGGGDQGRGYEAVAQVGGAQVELKWRVEVEESSLHIQYSFVPRGIVEVLGVQARISLAYADWEGDAYQLNGKEGSIPRERAASQANWTIGNVTTLPDLTLGPSHGRGGLILKVKAEKSALTLFDARYYGPILNLFFHHNEPVLSPWIWDDGLEKKFDFTIEFNRKLIHSEEADPDCTPVGMTSAQISQMPAPSVYDPPTATFTPVKIPNLIPAATSTSTRVRPTATSVWTSTPIPVKAVPTLTKTPIPNSSFPTPNLKSAGHEVGQRMPDPFLSNAPAVRASTSTFTAVRTATRTASFTPTAVPPTRTFTPTSTATRRIPTATSTRVSIPPTRTPTKAVVLRRPTATPTFLPLPSLDVLQPQAKRPTAVPKPPAQAQVQQQAQPEKPAAAAPEVSKPLPQWFPPLEESKTITIPLSAASIYVSFVKGYGHYEFKLADRNGKILMVIFDEDAGGDKDGQWIYWDGNDDKNQEVPAGKYFLLLYKDGKAVNTTPMIRKAGP